jgi:hypothetical protein
MEKVAPKFGLLLYFSKSKQSPNRRKIAQSGHPAKDAKVKISICAINWS